MSFRFLKNTSYPTDVVKFASERLAVEGVEALEGV